MACTFYYGNLSKNIWNNWITEASSESPFYSEGKKMIAKWEIVKGFLKHKKIQFVKLSELVGWLVVLF